MYLGNPLLPIKVTAQGAEELIRKKLLEKNWHDFELKPLKLNLVPYFLFNYHYFTEAESGRHNVVKSSFDGILAIDGHKVKIREDLTELLKENWKNGSAETPRINFEEKWCNIEKKELEEVLKLKTADHFDVPKDNVVVSKARKLFLPLYKTNVSIGKKDYHLTVNAVDGKIFGIELVSEREKGYGEVTRETINELRDPGNWLRYAKESVFAAGGALVSAGAKQQGKSGSPSTKKALSLLDSRTVFIIIILLGLVLFAIGLFRIRLA